MAFLKLLTPREIVLLVALLVAGYLIKIQLDWTVEMLVYLGAKIHAMEGGVGPPPPLPRW